MIDRDSGPRFDYDPTRDKPLRSETVQFLQDWRASDEFRYRYEGNLDLHGNFDVLNEIGKRHAMWSIAFVGRLFGLSTLDGTERFLEPWIKWGEGNRQIWDPCWNGDITYEKAKRQYARVAIPDEIKSYQGDLTDKELRWMAHWDLFELTREFKGAIDLLEGVPKPVSLDTIFRVQRITNQSVTPAGGLEEDIVTKPSLRKVDFDGKSYFTFDIEGEPADIGYEDISSEQEWKRWNEIQVGTHIKYLREDRQARQKTLETGVAQGFYLLAAGDEMLFAPCVANVGIVVVNEQTGFYQLPRISEIRLDSEEVTESDLVYSRKFEPVELVVMKPQTGEMTGQLLGSMEAAIKAASVVINNELGESE